MPVASGKGGVGKTALVASLGASLANKGQSVILIDLDLGASNLHTFLGIRNRNTGLGGYINKKEDEFQALELPSGIPGLSLIPGDSLLPGTANLNYFMKLKIMKAIKKLQSDFVILDLGAGSSFNTLDFFSMVNNGLVVTIPEITAVLNGYSFLKFTLYRMIFRQFPVRSEERRLIHNFLSDKIEGTEKSFDSLKECLAPLGIKAVEVIEKTLDSFNPKIIINRGKSVNDTEVGEKLRQIVKRNLNIDIEFISMIPESETVVNSMFKGSPAVVQFPDSSFSKAVSTLTDKLLQFPGRESPVGFPDEEDDLVFLKNEFAEL